MKLLKRILLDMDEVLTDFVGRTCKWWHVSLDKVLSYWVPGEWSIVEPIGKALQEKVEKRKQFYVPMTDERFWQKLRGDEYFWSQMKQRSWCDDTVELVKSLTSDWLIVSSPSRCHSSYSGKVKWLYRKFGETFTQFHLGTRKHIMAQPGVVLIDDCDANIQKFEAEGGIGVLWPAHHNRLHAHKDNPFAYVKERLLKLTQ